VSDGHGRRSPKGEAGVALVLVMMTITLFAAMVASLALVTLTETAISANYRDAVETLYAAEGVVEFALQEIAQVEHWPDLTGGSGQATMVDGPFKDLVHEIAGLSRVHVADRLADRSPGPKDDGASPRVLSVVGEARGPRGSRRTVEVLVEKGDSSTVRMLAWREMP
jgi:hypothetical protein